MALITWNDDLSVGVKEFDGQHQKLIAMINEMYDAMKAARGQEVIGSILPKLVAYTRTHFASEEAQMQKHGYPGYLGHKAEHEALTKQVTEYVNRLAEGKGTASVELMSFLKDWLTKHIKGIDKKYGPHLNSKGVA
jgi:hemerythrin